MRLERAIPGFERRTEWLARATGSTISLMIDPNPYQAYWNTVKELLGRDPRHKSSAIDLNGSPIPGWDADRATRALFEALDGPFWRKPATRTSGNWVWREVTPKAAPKNIEVGVERQVAEAGGADEWTCQMPTWSGIMGPRTHKRCAIDLVQRIGPDAYRIIELKVGSDTPLYALFELLFYAMTYLHARRNGYGGSGRYDVMQALHLELTVLAPEDWYCFKRKGEPHTFDYTWLADSISAALAALADPLTVQIRFDRFDWADNVVSASEDIRQRLKAADGHLS